MHKDIDTKENKGKKKNEYKVICKFSKDGQNFQKVMENILINKLNCIDSI